MTPNCPRALLASAMALALIGVPGVAGARVGGQTNQTAPAAPQPPSPEALEDEGTTAPSTQPQAGEPSPDQETPPAGTAPESPAEPDSAAAMDEDEAAVPALPVPPVSGGASQADVAEPENSQSARTSQGPESIADLAEGLLDAVVNISTSQGIEQPGRGIPPLEAPDGSPLQDFFDELLRGRDGPGERRAQSLGSGFVIDPSGIVVTNNHVIADADRITVNFANGDALDAELLGTDPKTDLAVLKVETDEPLPSVDFGDSDKLRIGDWVMAIGNPFGLGGSVSIGIVSARGRNINAGPYDNFIQTDAAINRGNSGGPLFDMDGNVVGINTAIISPTGGSIGIGFSVPSALAVNVIDQLREFGETRRGWLGIRLQGVTDEIAEGLGLERTTGAVIAGIIEGGPSDNGNLLIGDVVTSFDGRPVESSRDLPRMVAETEVGREVTIGILRKPDRETDAQPMEVQVTLGRLEDGERQMAEGESGASGETVAPSPHDDAPSGDDSDPEGGPVNVGALGLTLSDITEETRTQYNLGTEIIGVVVTEVAGGSPAADRGIEVGTVIREIAQETVESAGEVAEKVDELRSAGRRNALLLIAQPNGDLRFVVVPLE